MSQEILKSFYSAFQSLDPSEMAAHYHELAYFSDPVFQNLTADEVNAMWHMLVERSKGQLKIDFHSIAGEEDWASCTWEARYTFGKTGRRVHNVIQTRMTFEDDKIILHEDSFDFWKWSRMALGMNGLLLGWTPLLKQKVQQQARSSLMTYIIEENERNEE